MDLECQDVWSPAVSEVLQNTDIKFWAQKNKEIKYLFCLIKNLTSPFGVPIDLDY